MTPTVSRHRVTVFVQNLLGKRTATCTKFDTNFQIFGTPVNFPEFPWDAFSKIWDEKNPGISATFPHFSQKNPVRAVKIPFAQ
jgi:hypothetical protein